MRWMAANSARALREPRFALTVVGMLALGIGANVAMLALLAGVVWRPLPYRAPAGLYAIREIIPSASRQFPTLPVNYRSFVAWRGDATRFSGFALIHPAVENLTGRGEPQPVVVGEVSANLFQLLGVRPTLGRAFASGEDSAGRNHELVLSDAYWRQAMGGSPSVIGETVDLDGAACQVVGVVPASFYFPTGGAWGTFVAEQGAGGEPQMFQPLVVAADKQAVIGNFDFAAIARLRAGVTPAAAHAELNAMTAHLVATQPAAGLAVLTALTPLAGQVVGTTAGRLRLLWLAVLAALAVVCLNLANLAFARAHARAPEAALRLALGAGRGRLAAEALGQSLVLAGLGAAAGLGLAEAALQWVRHDASTAMPRVAQVHLGPWALAGGVGLTLAAAVGFALAPALAWARVEPGAGLKLASPTFAGCGRGRSRRLLVAAESGLTALLLILAGLLLHSYVRLGAVQPGYTASTNLVAGIRLSGPAAARGSLWSALPPRFESLPGVAAAALTTELPLGGTGLTSTVTLPGDTRPEAARPIANFQYVSPGYFRTMGVGVRGREFEAGDSQAGHPDVAVVSTTAAGRIWPGQDALGKTFTYVQGGAPITVVGVARDVRTALRQPAGPMIFQPIRDDLTRALAYAVVQPRPGIGALTLLPGLRGALGALQPLAVVTSARTMRSVRSAAVAPERFQLDLAAGFGLCALLIAGLGVYGLVAFTLEQRRRELSLRLALGARPAALRAWAWRQGLEPVLGGLAAALLLAWLIAPALAAQLYGINARDPWALAGGAFAVVAAAALACWPLARRAGRVDPAAVLR